MNYVRVKNAIRLMVAVLCLGSSLSIISETVHAQETAGPDELFTQARDAAFKKDDFKKAIDLAQQALAIAPDYLDIKEFLGRIYVFDSQYDKGISTLTEVLSKDQDRIYARLTLIDAYLNTSDLINAQKYADEGLNRDGANVDLLFKKALIMEEQGKTAVAYQLYKQVEQINPSYPFLKARISSLSSENLDWAVHIHGINSQLNQNLDPWNIGGIGLTHYSRFGDFTFEVNYGSRFDLNDQEFQIVGYPVINSKTYAYVNGAVSGNTFFPEYRWGASIYRVLPRQFEFELGARGLSFPGTNVLIYTSSINKYIPNYRFSARAFVTTIEGSAELNSLIMVRRNLRNINTYFEVRGGYGSASNLFNSQQDINRENTIELGLNLQYEVSRYIMFFGDVGYYREEFDVIGTRTRIDTRLGLRYLFKGPRFKNK